jgi:hypothetical protein
MYEKQRTMLNQDARQQVVYKMQQYVYDQIPAIPYVYPNSIQAYRNDRVTDLTPIPGDNGYIIPNYGYTMFVDAKPADNADSSGSSSSGLPAGVWVVIAAVAAGVAVFFIRRSGRTSDDEA